ncbi:hypothetical protein DL239_18770 [Sedimentitalea sp. CY04]|uniref:Uncharacterized protein n=1 Tax=Parasedimentitalea denitrificans TaxID=2211118 RepID=A0ABX0WEB0_9RHOB|nr:hypothetical protein [Sedimentitalea sp. CY04]
MHQDDAGELYDYRAAAAARITKTGCKQAFACVQRLSFVLVFSQVSLKQVRVGDHVTVWSARSRIEYPLVFAVWRVPVP